MKKIFFVIIALLALSACKMDFYPSDSMTTSQLRENPSAAVYTTDAIYALFKDNLPYKGQEGGEAGNFYLRHYFQLTESRGDNVTISGHSIDPFLGPYEYKDVDGGKNKYYTWWIAYRIILAANSNIEGLEAVEKPTKLENQLLGENYFFRALVHFNLVTLFAMPYVCGRDNPGIPLRIGMDYSKTERATVGAVYDAVVEDLKKAYDFMSKGEKRGDASYVSATAAKALLSRVYLYMGDEHLNDCVTICNELLASAPKSVLGEYTLAQWEDYPKETWSSPETIWCVHHVYPADHQAAEATIGAMYNVEVEESNGWGQWYWNDELIELFNRYPADRRFQAYFTYVWYPKSVVKADGKKMVCFPVVSNEEDKDFGFSFRVTAHNSDLTPDTDGSYNITYNGKNYKAVPEQVNGYTRYFINADLAGDPSFWGGKTPAYVRENIDETNGIRNDNYVRYLNTKFSGQDGQVTMSSPVILRWGEVILNRAEAYARLKNNDAINDVNTMRKRAGIAASDDFNTGNLAARGYTGEDALLDLVLDERRMELCFEGHRMFDLIRNKRPIDRRYVGYHPWEIINYDDPRIALLIPIDEIAVSGIPQNKR